MRSQLRWLRTFIPKDLETPYSSLEEGSGDLGSKQLADLVAPITDVDTTARQVFQSKTNFPYTETPILPPEVYRKGLSSREKLRELPGMDPIFVVKTPTWSRNRPSGVKLPVHCLRSTWILVHGKVEKTEDRAPPVQQQSRSARWVELACFQFHAPTSTLVVSADARPSAHNRAPRPSARRSGPNTGRVDPELTFGTECLLQQARWKPKAPFSLHEGTPHSSRVISVLIRIVHGGRSMGGPPTTPRSTHTKHMASAATTTSQVPDQWKWIDGRTLESARESCAD